MAGSTWRAPPYLWGNVENCQPGGNDLTPIGLTSTRDFLQLDFFTMTVCNLTKWTAAVALGLCIAACSSGGGDTANTTPAADTLKSQDPGNGLVNVGGKLFSIPSPVQAALLMRKLGMPYDASLPLGTDSTAQFTTNHRMALAMGIHGADLAYCTVHKDGQRALKILMAVEGLGDKLNLKSAFDRTLMDGFKKNIGNEDSLLRMGGTAFRAVDMYLKNDQRNDVSALVLAGGWIESLYLTVGKSDAKLDPRVVDRIAEQRHSLDNLISLLKQGQAPSALVDSLQGLANSFDGVKYTYTYTQPTVDAANKTTYINSVTKAEVPAGTMETIIRKVRALRSSITA